MEFPKVKASTRLFDKMFQLKSFKLKVSRFSIIKFQLEPISSKSRWKFFEFENIELFD